MVLYADKKELESFLHFYGRFLEKVPAIKTQALYAAAKSFQEEVRRQIQEQGVHDSFGRVKRWQQVYLGSKGGYAAVRPMAEHTQKTWKGKSVFSSQITRWLEKGHGARRSRGGFYQSGVTYVKGYMFYSWAKSKGLDAARNAFERELDRITDEWEWE